jgi:hypothetical protein
MTHIPPRKGFDWDHVAWSGPRSPAPALCSYCSAGIPEESIPLMLFKLDGACAKFCDNCQRKWWGIETFTGEEP